MRTRASSPKIIPMIDYKFYLISLTRFRFLTNKKFKFIIYFLVFDNQVKTVQYAIKDLFGNQRFHPFLCASSLKPGIFMIPLSPVFNPQRSFISCFSNPLMVFFNLKSCYLFIRCSQFNFRSRIFENFLQKLLFMNMQNGLICLASDALE